jgi:tRNA1Val (adenine37-N6)-methyltransferase
MANNFFKFKQFTIFQDKCAMKVCTDACLFGAYVANEIVQRKWKIDNCLDIGTGTGLLSLMLAQKNDVKIDAVEIDENTFLQASENIKSSIFKKNITVYHKNILEFDTEKKYDLIIANPPFFENDLLSENNLKNTAKHNTTLTLDELIAAANNLLSATGHFAMLLPYRRLDYLEKIALGYGFYLSKKILITQTPTHGYFRGILFFSKNNVDSMTEELSIKNSTGKYSNEFVALLKDYYLAPF